MNHADPYDPPASPAMERSSIPGRMAVLSIHFALLIAVLLGGPALSELISADPGDGTLETELTGLDDFLQAFKNYSFIPVMLIILLDLPVYFVIRILKGRPTRWTWLLSTTALIPVAIFVYYVALWPMIRIPITV